MYPFDLANKNGYYEVENLVKRYLSAFKIEKLKANKENPTELFEYLSKKFSKEDADLDELLAGDLQDPNEKEKYKNTLLIIKNNKLNFFLFRFP
jgi:hypothetical protein